MSRIKTVLACTILMSSLASAVPGAVPQLLASGKWDLWDDSAETSRPQREGTETRPEKRAETAAAPARENATGDEAKTGDAGLQAGTDNVRPPDTPAGHEAPVPEQTVAGSRKPVVDGQSPDAGSARRPEAKAAQAAPAPKQNGESPQSPASGQPSRISGDADRPAAEAAQAAPAPQQPASGEHKEAGTGLQPGTVASGKSAETVPAGIPSGAKKETPSAGGAPGSAGTVSVTAGEEYIIGSGDILDISVWKDEVLSRTVVVLTDGTFSFPLIGKISAAGRTINQVKNEIVGKLVRYYPEPEVSMEVKQSNSMLIYVIGRVNAPGRQMLNANIDVIQALAMAGGLNPFAGRNKIKILRKEGGRTVVLPFRYDDVIEGKIDTNIELKRGDVVVVP